MLLLVVLLIFTTLRLPVSERLKSSLSDGFLPFLEFSTRVQNSFGFLVYRFKGYKSLQIENTDLKKELSELSTRVAQVTELERENREFRSMLDFKDRSELKLITAKVISRDPSNWYNTILIDRGSNDGVTANMPVLTVEGLVGKTIDITKTNARVILIVDENCKVSAWLKDSAQYGIVQGNILAGGTDSQCRMTFLSRSAHIKSNDRVYTSGLGGIFPKGLLIGVVRSVQSGDASEEKNTLYQEIGISPAVDLARIDEVFVGIGVKPAEKAKPAPKASK